MEVVKIDEKNNQILGADAKLENSQIIFRGSNNCLVFEEGVVLKNSILDFKADNSIMYISANRNDYFLNASIYNNSVFFIGRNNYINGRVNISVSEERNVFIGDEGLFSFGIWIRIADPHLIYDAESLKRINLSKSIYLGDHVWVGQDALILKGTQIGSGSIIGAKAVVSNKKISSNTLWGGIPAREIRKNVLFDASSVHYYTERETQRSLEYDSSEWVYKNEGRILSFDEIDGKLISIKDADEKISFIESIVDCRDYNRFYVGGEKSLFSRLSR